MKLIVDEVDQFDKQKEELVATPIESIEEERCEEVRNEEALRVPFQKLQEEREMMKRVIRSEPTSGDTANMESENLSLLTHESITEEGEGVDD